MSAKDQIKQIVDYFKREPQLKDKTDGMAEGLLLGADLADEANERSKNATETTLAVQEKYKEQILAQDLNPNKDPELVDLRNGEQTAGERIAKFEQQTTEQLAQIQKSVKDYGVVADGVTDDSDALQEAFDNETNPILPANAVIALSKSVKFQKDNASLTSNGCVLKALEPMEYVIKFGKDIAPAFANDINVTQGFEVNANGLAQYGILGTNVRQLNLHDPFVYGAIDTNIRIQKDPINNSEYPSICQANVYNPLVERGNYNVAEPKNTGLYIDTDDCYIQNYSGVGQTTAIVNKGNNTFSKAHAWVLSDYQMANGVFFDTDSGANISEMFSDTYPIDYLIRNNIGLTISDSQSYLNEQYYTFDKIVNSVLPYPIKFKFDNEEAKKSTIKANNSKFAGATDGGGHLFNTKEFVPNAIFNLCTFTNLKEDMLESYQRDSMRKNWESGALVTDTASTFVPKKDEFVSVTLKPYTIIAEDMNGNFDSSKNRWYAKNSNAVLNLENNALKATGNGTIDFAVSYENVDSATWLFIRFGIKCSKNVKVILVNRETGIEIGTEGKNTFNVPPQSDWHNEYIMAELPLTNETDVEIIFKIASDSDTGSNQIELREFTLFDIYKRNIGYMFETTQDLAQRLFNIGFVLDKKTLPLPTGQDFLIKSIPKNYGYRIVIPEVHSGSRNYSALRSLEGLIVKGTEGSNAYKVMTVDYFLSNEARLRGNLYHLVKHTIRTKNAAPLGTTFSDNIQIDGVFKKLHSVKKSKILPIEIERTNSKISIQKLLTTNDVRAGNEIAIEEQIITPLSEPQTYTSPYMNSSSGYHRMPVFKGGVVTVVSGGSGFADVEILKTID